jgi:DNA-binding response OmpR family regulator
MKVLIIEDSPRMARALQKGLREEGYSADVAADGAGGLHLARTGEYDAALLDLGLPDRDGLALLRELRRSRSDLPVILVTARDSVEDRVQGLDAGADDYLAKPFSFHELLARLRAVLRRPGARAEPVLRFEDLEFDPARGSASRAGRPLSLSAREFALLRALMAHPGRVLTRTFLYETVWGSEYDGASNVLDVYINYLRRKLEEGGGGRVIHTVRGRGYLFGKEA